MRRGSPQHNTPGRGSALKESWPGRGGRVPWKVLAETLDMIEKRIDTIENNLLPKGDRSQYRTWDSEYSDEQLAKHIKAFEEIFLEEYERMVAINFPTSKKHCSLYSQLPIRKIIEITTDQKDTEHRYVRIHSCPKSERKSH